MAKSFLDFVNERKANKENLSILNESFQAKDMDKAIDLIDKLLSKHIKGLVPLVGYVDTVVNGKACKSKQFLVLDKDDPYKSAAFQFNWALDGNSTDVYSIDFFKDGSDLIWNGKAKSDLSIGTLGTSVVTFLPIVWTVVTSGDYKLSKKEAAKLQQSVFKDGSVDESLYYIGNLCYHILEGLNDNLVVESFKLNTLNVINEAELSPELKAFKKKKYDEKEVAYAHRKDSEEASEKYKQLKAEYTTILDAIKGGATNLGDLSVAIWHGQNVEVVTSEETKKQEAEIEEKKDPDQVFKEMQHYIKMVTKGLQPSLIICGAPGVGKTFKVKQQLKAAGYHEDELGNGNMVTIKGKCSPRALYLALYEHKNKNEITLIDDADGLVGPNAPEESINILKAALDSTADDEGRLVTYGVAGKILDNNGNEIPKRFYYRGGVIVLTNWTAGKLDSALRGRSFIQDIHFDTEDILKIIKKLLPSIEPQMYTMKAKLKAYDYLMELYEQGSDMELSLRTFNICAKMYQTADGDNDFTEEEVRSMIKEQMKMQALKGGKKY